MDTTKTKIEPQLEPLADAPSKYGEPSQVVTHDAVFGEITEDGPNYRNVKWMGTTILMIKCQVGLGILSAPKAFDSLGMIPGVLLLLTIILLTTWTSYVIGPWKVLHPETYGIDDAVGVMFGPIGREMMGISFILYLVTTAGSGYLSISIAFNAVSTHGTCTAIFVAVAACLVTCLASIRTLGKISILAWAGLASTITSILIVAIAVGVQKHPDDAPPGPWESDWKWFGNPSFYEAVSAISTFIFALSGAPYFFPIVSEMQNPKQYTKALLVCQAIVASSFLIIGIIVYYYCGSYVASPALGSAGALIKKVAYGIGLPGLLVSSTLSTHLASKHIFVKILRGSRHLTSNSLIHWACWIGSVCGVAIVAYVVASTVPVFGDLVSLVGALLGTLMAFQPPACMWLFDNWSKGKQQKTMKWMVLVALNVFIILAGTFLMVGGTYGAIVSIIRSYAASGGSAAFSCADNSNSVH